MTFAVYPENNRADINMVLENSSGNNFPRVSVAEVPADQWTEVSVPLDKLNPSGLDVNRIGILESSGSPITFYIDQYLLTAEDPEI